jgi:hypothetical protein
MKTHFFPNLKTAFSLLLLMSFSLFFVACEEDDNDDIEPLPDYENSVTYNLNDVNDSGVNGFVVFGVLDGSLQAEVRIEGLAEGETATVSIHENSVVEGGNSVIDIISYEEGSGRVSTPVNDLNFEQLEAYDGHINVTSSDGQTILAQNNIGGNILTGASTSYNLVERAVEGISGSVLFEERRNGSTKATITLEGTPDNGTHPAHIHMNTAAEGGPIAITFNPVNGTTGMSVTDIENFDEGVNDGAAVTYSDIIGYDGYVNVHLSPDDLATIVAQGDIGVNELTGNTTVYDLGERDVEGISGTATFSERISGETLVILDLEGTPEDGTHPAHIHMNTAAEGGGIVVTFNPVDGATGMSRTNVTSLDGGDNVTYEDLIAYDGYINVHLSADNLATIVAQGDIGVNDLTGESTVYDLNERDVEGISGNITFFERVNGNMLAVIELDGTPENGSHPAHIHANTAAEGGPIVVSFTPVDGTTGRSETTIRSFDDGTPLTYEGLLDYDGYVNVHLSQEELTTIVAQGNIGANDLSDNSVNYDLSAVGDSGVSGTATFTERIDGTTQVVIMVNGTEAGNTHPAHIHFNSVEEGGAIAISLNPVDGASGMSRTQVETRDNNVDISYDELLEFDGYINVHLSPDNLATVVASGNIGANAPE